MRLHALFALTVVFLPFTAQAEEGSKDTAAGACRATQVSVGLNHACAVVDGAAKCWGGNLSGESGTGAISAPVPVSTAIPSGVASIAAGSTNTCAVMTSGTVKCWGHGMMFQAEANTATPKDVAGLTGAKAMSVGTMAGWALLGSGQVKVFGAGPVLPKVPAVKEGLEKGVTAIAANEKNFCAIVGGAAKCGSIEHRMADIPGLKSGVTSIAAGAFGYGCAVVKGGVKCWGFEETPVDVAGLKAGVGSVAVGGRTSCAVLKNGPQSAGATTNTAPPEPAPQTSS